MPHLQHITEQAHCLFGGTRFLACATSTEYISITRSVKKEDERERCEQADPSYHHGRCRGRRPRDHRGCPKPARDAMPCVAPWWSGMRSSCAMPSRCASSRCRLHRVAKPDEGVYQLGTFDVLSLDNIRWETLTIGKVSAMAGKAAVEYVVAGNTSAARGEAGAHGHGATEQGGHASRRLYSSISATPRSWRN